MARFDYGNECVTIEELPDVEILEYLDPAGRSPFALWFAGLNAVATARVTVALMRAVDTGFILPRTVSTS